jgi:predicted DNA binding protein
MREFVFALEYEPGNNPVADILAEFPETQLRSLSCHVTTDTLWRVDHISGAKEALEAVADAVATADYYADCLVRRDCQGEWDTRVLDRTADTLILYSYWNRTVACTSIPHLALEHFGDGLIFETTWRGRRYQWRLILPGDAKLTPFYDTLAAEIAETAGVDIIRVKDTDASNLDIAESESGQFLSPEQESALRAAVEYGYYETPRAIETYELAELLGIPGSTLSYRLRRAEAHLAGSYVKNMPFSQLPESDQ